jgi:hypothetical protein
MRFVVAALALLAACASPSASRVAPTGVEIGAAVLAEMNARAASDRAQGASVAGEVLGIEELSCRPDAEGCFQCSYAAHVRETSQWPGQAAVAIEQREPRADVVCNATGSWTLTPMSQIGS